MDKMREQFEAWATRHNESLREDEPDQPEDIRLDRQAGAYIWANAESAWLAWKASRESFVLHLPHMADYVNMLGQVDKCYSYLDDLHAAIHAAGIRTK